MKAEISAWNKSMREAANFEEEDMPVQITAEQEIEARKEKSDEENQEYWCPKAAFIEAEQSTPQHHRG